MTADTCFSCGEQIIGHKCKYCGFEFSFENKCPRRLNEGITCVHNLKLCTVRDWENCLILRAND